MRMPNWLRYLCAGIFAAAALELGFGGSYYSFIPLALVVVMLIPRRRPRHQVMRSPDEERLTILVNRNVKMSPNKLAAQAVHAALLAYGIDHGAVIVLDASPTKLREECDVLVRDAGRTEIPPGTLTAGVRR